MKKTRDYVILNKTMRKDGKKMKAEYLECGKIINTHGTKGAIKVENRCDAPRVLASLPFVYLKNGVSYVPKKVLSASVFREFVIMELEGVSSLEEAMLLKNRLIFAHRPDLPLNVGAFFLADIEGLPVIDEASGKEYGRLREVINRGASDIYVIDTPAGERMIPAVKEFIKKVDTEKGIFVAPIPGMLED